MITYLVISWLVCGLVTAIWLGHEEYRLERRMKRMYPEYGGVNSNEGYWIPMLMMLLVVIFLGPIGTCIKGYFELCDWRKSRALAKDLGRRYLHD